MGFSPVTAIAADIANGSAISEEFELWVSLAGDPEGVYEEVGKIQSDGALKIAREFVELGDDWLNLPKTEKASFEGKLLQTGDIRVMAHILGKSIDQSGTEYDVVGLSDKPEPPGKYPYQLRSSTSDGRAIIIQFWKGQMVCPEFSVQGNDPSNPPTFTLNAAPDPTKGKHIRRGEIRYEKR